MRRWLRLLFALVIAGVLLLACEGAAHLLLGLRDASRARGMREEAHCRYDAELGWANIPDLERPDLFGKGVSFTTNHEGFRALHEFTPEVPAGRFRIACLGDSFTEGYGVGDRETFPAWLQTLEPRIETLNLGLGGYGVDQSWLQWRRHAPRHHADLLLCSWIVFDFLRMNTLRFQGEYPKPFLVARGDQLEVTNVPVPEYWNRSGWLRPLKGFVERSALFQVLQKLVGFESYVLDDKRDTSLQFAAAAELVLMDLRKTCAEHNTRLVLVWLPVLRELPIEPKVHAWLLETAARHGIPVVDLTPEFQALSREDHRRAHQQDGHYSSAGNRLVAEALLARLRALVPELPR
jgi:hypothetical protein